MPFQPKSSYTYNDLGLVPRNKSSVARRDGVNPKTDFLGIQLDLPILLAPMETVVGYDMAVRVRELGGLAILPRYYEFNKTLELVMNW